MASYPLEKMQNNIKKMAQYLVSEVATKKDLDKKADKHDVELIKADVGILKTDVAALKTDVKTLIEGMGTLLTGMDGQAKQLDIIRTEQSAMHRGVQRVEARLDQHEKVGH